MAAPLTAGGRAVFVKGDTVMLAKGELEVELVDLERIPFTAHGRIPFQVCNALAATAAAWAAGLNPAIIVRALTTFKTDNAMAPGRFNLHEINGVQVILDYAHNAAALRAMGDAVHALGERKTLVVIGLPGDRRDQDLVASIKATTLFAHGYVLYDLADRRGRAEHEVPRLLQSGLPAHTPCELASNEHDAILRAWDRVRPGDRLVVILDDVDRSLQTLRMLSSLKPVAEEDGSCLASMPFDSVENSPAHLAVSGLEKA
jgi:cyanophycin synthetase